MPDPLPLLDDLLDPDGRQILLGYDVNASNSPIYVTRDFLGEGHTQIRGRTSSGKSMRAFLLLLMQLMSPHLQNGIDRRDPIYIFDLGGDRALFYFVKRRAEQLGRRFRFLSLHPDDDGDFFDPFQALRARRHDVIRQATLLTEAFGVEAGTFYGAFYYSGQNLAALLRVVRKLSREEGRRLKLHDVANYLERDAVRKKIKDADQIRMICTFLTEYPQLMVDENTDPSRCIDMDRALEDGEVIYFFTPTLSETMTARQIAGLGLYNLVNAAMERSRRGLEFRQAWVFVDEFHELAGRAFGALLAQSRKFGIGLFLGHQTSSQLEDRDTSLHDTVLDNTHLKVYFSVTCRRDIDDLQALSAEEEYRLPGRSTQHLSTSSSEHTVLLPCLRKNEILDISGTEGNAIVILDDGKGHHEPYRAEIPYFIADKGEYLAARQTPLPARPEGNDIRAKVEMEAKRASLKDEIRRAVDPERRAKMAKVLSQKRLAEKVVPAAA